MLRMGVRRGAVSQYYPDNPSFKGYTFPPQIGKVGTDCEAQKHLSRDNQESLLGWWQDLPVTHPESAWAWRGTGRRPVTRRSLPARRAPVSREWAQSAAETRAANIRQQVRTEDRGEAWRHWVSGVMNRERENILATCTLWVEGGGLPLNLIDF